MGERMHHKDSYAQQKAFAGFRRLEHQAESCVCHSPGPVMGKRHRSRHTPGVTDAPGVLLERPRLGRPPILPKQSLEVPRFLSSEVRVRSEYLIFRAIDDIIAGARNRACS
jgi:hypothetical protein